MSNCPDWEVDTSLIVNKHYRERAEDRLKADLTDQSIKAEIGDWKWQHLEPGVSVIWGTPIGHRDFTEWMRTSVVVAIRDGKAITLNSIYQLTGEQQ